MNVLPFFKYWFSPPCYNLSYRKPPFIAIYLQCVWEQFFSSCPASLLKRRHAFNLYFGKNFATNTKCNIWLWHPGSVTMQIPNSWKDGFEHLVFANLCSVHGNAASNFVYLSKTLTTCTNSKKEFQQVKLNLLARFLSQKTME